MEFQGKGSTVAAKIHSLSKKRKKVVDRVA